MSVLRSISQPLALCVGASSSAPVTGTGAREVSGAESRTDTSTD